MADQPKVHPPAISLPHLDPAPEAAPGAYATLPPEPPHRPLWRHRGFVAAALCVAWIAGVAAGADLGGVGGWNGGLVGMSVIGGVGAFSVVWAACGNAVVSRGWWGTAALVLAVTVTVPAAGSAPDSAARLRERIDRMHLGYQFYRQISERTAGHGWCAPQCPEVVRVYRSPNGSYPGALAVAFVGLRAIGLETNIKQDYNQQVGLVIRRYSPRIDAVVSLDRVNGLVEMTVDLTAKRG